MMTQFIQVIAMGANSEAQRAIQVILHPVDVPTAPQDDGGNGADAAGGMAPPGQQIHPIVTLSHLSSSRA